MKTIYLYDGSFEGLLTAIYQSYYLKDKPDKIISEKIFQPNLLDQTYTIETDLEKSEKVYESIYRKISHKALRNVYHVYLSEEEEAATIIYQYLRLGWKIGASIESNLLDDRVMAVDKICLKVKKEKHWMLGLVRFQQLVGDFYYAVIEPKYNITGLISPHFLDRMGELNWMIHDKKRELASVCLDRQWVITDLDSNFSPQLDQSEKIYQSLWKEYFANLSIKERHNPKLQRKNMPAYYWNNLIEKQKDER